VVVVDLDRAMLHYGLILGIDRWAVFDDSDRATGLTVDGLRSCGRWRTATGTTPSGAATFELVEPLDGLSMAQLFRAGHGEGIMALNFSAGSPAELDEITGFFAAHSAGVAQRLVLDESEVRVTFDTRDLLGGYLVSYRAPLTEGAVAGRAPDREHDVGADYTRPPGVPALAVPRLHHIGIVVRDTMSAVRRHATVFDIDRWNFINWRPEPGRLEGPYYRGNPVDHEYLTGRAFNFQGFGFEMIQPTFGPSHYKNDYLERVGEGIHHLLIAFPSDEQEWDATIHWLASVNVPLVMGSEMRGGSGRFYYLDSREMLGGWVIEASFPRAGRPVIGPVNDFSIDFAAQKADLG
jgi:Glyoxalase/Bleomycin resistance protein/Dioxygenase superfamily